MEYLSHILIMLCIYIILVLSTNFFVQKTSLLTLCQAAFYGIGAYIGTFFLMRFNYSFLLIALLVMLGTGLTSLLVSLATTRLKSDYFLLGTVVFQLATTAVLNNWIGVTRGPYGILGIPSIKLIGIWSLESITFVFIFYLVVTVLVCLLFKYLQKAFKNNEKHTKTISFFISAAFAGLAGLLYASYVAYIDPTSFSIDMSLLILAALLIGGVSKRVWGPIVGATLLVILPELLRLISLPDSIVPVIFVAALIVIKFVRPQGLLGDKTDGDR